MYSKFKNTIEWLMLTLGFAGVEVLTMYFNVPVYNEIACGLATLCWLYLTRNTIDLWVKSYMES